MKTFLVLSIMESSGKAVFVGCFTDLDDLQACCHEDFVYAISGIKNGVPFHTTNYTLG